MSADLLAQWDLMVCAAMPVRWEKMDSRESVGTLDPQEPLVNQEFPGQLDSQDPKVHSASKESEDQLDPWEMLEIQDVQERRDTRVRREPVETRDKSVNWERRVRLDLWEV